MLQATITVQQSMYGWSIRWRISELDGTGQAWQLSTHAVDIPVDNRDDDHDALNAVYSVLLRHIALERSIGQAVEAPFRAEQ